MGRRLRRGGAWSALLGIVALAAAFGRMGTLLEPTEGWPPWQVTLGAAFVLGIALVVVGRALRIGLIGSIALSLVVLAIVMGRIADPDSMRAGFVPTFDTWDAVADQLSVGLEALRYGTAPLYPIAPFLLLLFPAFTAVGWGWAWLAASGRGIAAAVGPAGLYLAVAIADQGTATGWWVVGTVVWVGALLAVSGWEETASAPRVLGTPGRSGALAAGTLVVVVGLLATAVADGWVPGGGSLAWRESGAFGSGSGVSLNLFASEVQTNLVSRSEEVVFAAAVSGNVDPAGLYWPLITLDRYDGRRWAPSYEGNRTVDEDVRFERPDHRYLGATERVLARVRIGALRQDALPTLYSVRSFTPVTDSPVLERVVRARDDGALVLDGALTRAGLEYEIQAEVPSDELVDVALGADGNLPELFDRARDAGDIAPNRVFGTGVDVTPSDLDRFTELPDRLDPDIAALADDITVGTSSDLEALLLLETYFRLGDFTYTTDIRAGHGADDLAEWLLDPESPNYQTGYCEQFATAMGVMARTLGIPTRLVLGFGPGTPGGDGVVEVRGRNAHAWVEAWIDGIGWVRFDPTPGGGGGEAGYPASSAALAGVNLADYIPEEEANPLSGLNPGGGPILVDPSVREGLEEDVPTPGALEGDGVTGDEGGTPVSVPEAVWWGLGALLLVAAIPVAKWVRRRRRLARARHGDVSAAWAEITDRLRDLDREVTPAMTPDEIVRSTVPELAALATAHGHSSWGSDRPGPGETDAALSSFERSEESLRRSTPLARRLLATWRPRSLLRR